MNKQKKYENVQSIMPIIAIIFTVLVGFIIWGMWGLIAGIVGAIISFCIIAVIWSGFNEVIFGREFVKQMEERKQETTKKKNKKSFDEEEQRKGEMVEVITVVNSTRVLKGAKSFDDDTVRAISTLRDKGDSSAIPALEKLLTKVQKKVELEGMVREYIDNGIAAGYISPEDDIYHIESAIKEIKERSICIVK